jgi:hypothetical protein
MNAAFVETAWHEGDVNLFFDDRGDCSTYGLEPFYAAERLVRESGGSTRARCRVGDYDISVTRYYQGFAGRGVGKPTEFKLQTAVGRKRTRKPLPSGRSRYSKLVNS